MIRSITVTNPRGESVVLNLANPYQNGLAVTHIDGLNPPEASINNTELSVADGSVFNSSRVSSRNIVLEIKLLPNSTIAETRHALYKYFPIKKKVRLDFVTDTRRAYIDGYVETNDIDIFSDFEVAQISLICPYPYFRDSDVSSVDMNSVVKRFEFPFSNPVSQKTLVFGERTEFNSATIKYYGDEPTGVNINIRLHGATSDVIIANHSNGQRMVVTDYRIFIQTGQRLKDGDTISLGTASGSKFAYLFRDDHVYSILGSLGVATDWLVVEPGENIIEVDTINSSVNIDVSLYHNVLYGGL